MAMSVRDRDGQDDPGVRGHWLRGAIERLLGAGVVPTLSPVDVKHVQITNLLAVVSAGAMASWAVVAFATGTPVIGAENAAMAALYASVLAVNRAGRHGRATTLLLVLAHAQIGFALYAFGYPSGTPLWYSALIIGPYLAYPRRQRVACHGAAAAALLAWAASAALQDALPTRLAMIDPRQFQTLNTFLVGGTVGLGAAGFLWVVNQTEDALEAARARADRLLLNVLPASIAERLKARPNEAIADRHDEVTVLFADIVGFTELASRLRPTRTVDLLNQVFSDWDRFCDRLGVERVKTIGDGYMAIGGAPLPRADHAAAMVRLAILIRDHMDGDPTGEGLRVRIGLSSGRVVAGIVGTTRFHYDVWGDVVNRASRMESHGEPGRIQISRDTYERVRDTFPCEARGLVAIKGRGPTESWLVA
mgnify:CR=1 FL=1